MPRHRVRTHLTLSPECREKLHDLSRETGLPVSRIVEGLVMGDLPGEGGRRGPRERREVELARAESDEFKAHLEKVLRDIEE